MTSRFGAIASAVAVLLVLWTPPADAADPPPPGSPGATTTVPGLQLPPPPPRFGGVTGRNALESQAWWTPRTVPPEGAPNVLLIITDDVGYGAPSTFGGVIPTPALDRIAAMGLRYTNFHSTALCSPTRAALITGRNHHAVGFGVISEQATGFPGYDSVIPRDTATVGRILRDHGYSTSWFGKNHNTPGFQSSQLGPFDLWPTGMGFEYFYGFMGGDTNQWQPANLFRNTTQIYPFLGQEGWNLTTAMADEAIDYIRRVDTLSPGKPFLVKYAPGGAHAPHHPTPEWIEKIGALNLFDEGWIKLRETIFANQKRLGVLPPEAELTPWPADLLKTWDELTADEKKLFLRQVEIYAAYLAYTDHEIGRVIQEIEDRGLMENTLIVYISGDNGSSAEGTLNGTPNEVAMFNGIVVPVETQLRDFYDVWGTDRTYNHMTPAWTWAFNTPFRWTKQIAGYFGGTRQGLAISWPARIKDAGGVRNQFHHVIDIAPTILEAAGVAQPSVVDGVAQRPMDGVSMAYTFDAGRGSEASHRRTQYFEMMGQYAIYHDGWMASTKVTRPPWVTFGAANPRPDVAEWELFDLSADPTQAHDVSAAHPEKLAQLQAIFWAEAERHQVLPLDASVATRLATPRPSLTAGRDRFVFEGPFLGTPAAVAPSVLNSSYGFTAEVVVPEGGAEGVIVTQGGRFGGYALYLKDGRPVFSWNLFDLERVRWEAAEPLAPGRHVITFDFTYDGLGFGTLAFNDLSGIGRSGTGVLSVDGKAVATRKMERTAPIILQWDENFDVGDDTGTSIDDAAYVAPFPFTGTLERLTLTIEKPTIPEADRARMEAAMKAAQRQ